MNDRDAILLETLLRVRAIENLLIKANIMTADSFSEELKDLSQKVAEELKALLSKNET